MKSGTIFALSVACSLVFGIAAYADEPEVNFEADTQIKPLTKVLSAEEAATENSSDLDDVDYGQKLPELKCSDKRLKRQIANFVYSYVNRDGANSVIEQRDQYLLVRNLHEFVQIKEDDLDTKNNYSASLAVAFLKINANKEIYKICRSSGNNAKKFAELFAVIYRQGAYYQVVVPNVINSTKDIEKATFVFNW